MLCIACMQLILSFVKMAWWWSIDRYKSKVCLVLILCTCELNRNWSLFLVTNKSIEYIYWDRIGRMFKSLNSCRQEAFLLEFIIILIILFWILMYTWLVPHLYKINGMWNEWMNEWTCRQDKKIKLNTLLCLTETRNYFLSFSSRLYFALQNSHGHAKEFFSKFIDSLGTRPQKCSRALS